MNASVVFGTGQVGSHVISQLRPAGHDVTAVSRNGRQQFEGVANITGDATDPVFTTEVCAGAGAIYFCLDAPDYHRWPEESPPLQRGVLTAAQAVGARLVVLENLYAYGPTHGKELHESLPLVATTAKGQTRAQMTMELLDAHERGAVEVATGRASDYVGPGATHSALGEHVFANALRGKTAQIMGEVDAVYTLDDLFCTEHRGAWRGHWHATQRGQWQGVAPSGREVAWDVIIVGRFADGKLAEDWVAYDRLGLFQQLGELPLPREA